MSKIKEDSGKLFLRDRLIFNGDLEIDQFYVWIWLDPNNLIPQMIDAGVSIIFKGKGFKTKAFFSKDVFENNQKFLKNIELYFRESLDLLTSEVGLIRGYLVNSKDLPEITVLPGFKSNLIKKVD